MACVDRHLAFGSLPSHSVLPYFSYLGLDCVLSRYYGTLPPLRFGLFSHSDSYRPSIHLGLALGRTIVDRVFNSDGDC